MKINLSIKNVKIELEYFDSDGFIKTARNIDTDTFLTLYILGTKQPIQLTHEYNLLNKEDTTYNCCFGQYIKILELNTFVPKYIFIQNVFI